jgi:hypothetical protein
MITLPQPPLATCDKPIGQPICVMPEPMELVQRHPEMLIPGIDAPEVCEPIVVEGEPPFPAVVEDEVEPQADEPMDSENESPLTPVSYPSAYSPQESVPMMPYIVEDEEDTCNDVVVDYSVVPAGSLMFGAGVNSNAGLVGGLSDNSTRSTDADPLCGLGRGNLNGSTEVIRGGLGGMTVCGAAIENSAPCGILRLMQCLSGSEICMECTPRSLGEAIAEYLAWLAGDEEACEDPAVPEEPVEALDDEPMDEEWLDDEPMEDATDEEPSNPDDQVGEEARDEQPTRQDPHHDHHYPSCPYTGRCPYPYHYNIPRVDPPAPRHQDAEEQEPMAEPVKPPKPVKKKFLWFMGNDMGLCQPGVDTMECRPDDIHGEVEAPF